MVAQVRQIPIAINRAQRDLLFAPTNDCVFVGGIASGKTLSACLKILTAAKPRRHYMGVFRTASDIKDTIIPAFEQACAMLGRAHSIRQTDFRGWFETGQKNKPAKIIFRSPDNGRTGADSLRGPNLSGVWIDEACYFPEYVYPVLSGRLREAGEAGWMLLTTTPKGRSNWVYKHCVETKAFHEIKSRTDENPFAPKELVTRLRRIYGKSIFARQELDGEWVDNEAQVIKEEWLADAQTPNCLWSEGASQSTGGSLWVGYDVGGKRDAAAISTIELVGDTYWLRELVASTSMAYPSQLDAFLRAMRRPAVRKGVIDKGTQGLTLYDDARRRISESKLVGLSVSDKVNQEVAERIAVEFENRRVRIPMPTSDLGRELEADLRLAQWGPDGQVIKLRDETGHADRFDSIGFAIRESVNVKPSRVSRPPVIATHGIGTRRYTA